MHSCQTNTHRYARFPFSQVIFELIFKSIQLKLREKLFYFLYKQAVNVYYALFRRVEILPSNANIRYAY